MNGSAITEAIAYKRDGLPYELICIAMGSVAAPIEIPEQMPGWLPFVHAFPNCLPGCGIYEERFSLLATGICD